MSARTYACPACGAQVDEQGRHCRYCGAPVATVRCASCFHMNVPEAGYCSGCGSQLGLEPMGEAANLACPVCKKPLEAYRDGPGAVFDCGSCGGQFVEHAMLRQLVERHAHTVPNEGPVPRPPWRPEPRTGYIPCPSCASLMNRKNYGGVSGVIVDVCKRHGVWFDLGELPRVLAFVDAGGLERARQRVEEEAAERKHAAAAAAAAAEAMHPRVSQGASAHIDAGFSITELLADLFMH